MLQGDEPVGRHVAYSGRQVWLEKEGGTWQVGGMVVQMA